MNKTGDRAQLKALKDTIKAVTCTQENDIQLYIETLHNLERISDSQKNLYRKLIDKSAFKTELLTISANLTPKTQIVSAGFEPDSFPLVIKPLGFSGSKYVEIISSKKELDVYFSKNGSITSTTQCIAEEFLVGPQYSLNVYVDKQGKTTFCPLTRVIPAFELGHTDTYSAIQYTTNELTAQEMTRLATIINLIVQHFQVQSCTLHFDLIKNTDTFKVIEVGMRIGGLREELFSRSSEFSHISNDVLNRLGITVTTPPLKRYVSMIQKGAHEPGHLEEITHPQKINSTAVFTDKIFPQETFVKPVHSGGTVVYRGIITAEKEPEVVSDSLALFNEVNVAIRSEAV